MRHTRLIPILLIYQGGVYKTRKFKNPLYIGDPINTIRLFNDLEVDEIMILDINASKEKREPDYEMVEELASEAFMPVGYGGGIRTVEQAKLVLNCGVEKVVVNNAAHTNSALIQECVARFGSQSVVVSIDYAKKILGGLRQYDHVSRKFLQMSPLEAAESAEKLGAGEILLNCVDRDGSMEGLDVELVQEASRSLSVPIVACGGAGSLHHLKEIEEAGASAIGGGSFFVFRGKQRGILISYPAEEVLREYLR